MSGLGSGIGVLSPGGGCDPGNGIEGDHDHDRGGGVSGLSCGDGEKRDECLKDERGGKVELSVDLILVLVWYRWLGLRKVAVGWCLWAWG